MSWSIGEKSWNEVSPVQKWFACVDALAHLEYLLGRGRVGREVYGGRVLFGRRGVTP